MNPSPHQWKNWQRIMVTTLVLFIIVSGSIAVYRYVTRVVSPLPENISSQLSFSPLIISADSKSFSTSSYKFSTAEDNIQILTFIITTKDNIAVSVSEYVQPPQFTDIPEYRDRFLTNVAKQYATVPTASGTIYLGRMAKQDNKQLAVMIEKGLLIFLTPEKEMNEAQWRALGNSLELQAID